MSKKNADPKDDETYYVRGSGLIAIPYARVNEIPKVKLEVHAEEARRAIMVAQVPRRLA